MKITGYLFLLTFILLPFSSKGQNRITLSLAQNMYIGDLNPSGGSFFNPGSFSGQLGFNLGFEHHFDENVYSFIEIGYGKYEASYSLRSNVDHIKFLETRADPLPRFIQGSFKEAIIGFNWIFFSFDWMEAYTGVGFGVMNFKITDAAGTNLKEIDYYRAPDERFSPWITQMPLKLGLQFFSNSFFNIGYEINWTFTNTDYLDNVGEYGKPGSDAIFKQLVKIRIRITE